MKNKKTSLLLVFTVMLSLPVLYTNCGAQHEGTNVSLSASDKLQPLFKNTFYPFLRTNCTACHAASGRGSGKFAASSIDMAFSDFFAVGSQKIAEYASSNNHNYPYTGSQHATTLAGLTNSWNEGVKELAGDGIIPDDSFTAEVSLAEKLLGLGTSKLVRNMVWVLPANVTENNQSPQLDLSKLTISNSTKLELDAKGNGASYSFGYPSFKLDATASSGLFIKGVQFSLNSKAISENSFYDTSVCLRPGEELKMSQGGAIAYERVPEAADRFGMRIEKIVEKDCPSPDELPKVFFSTVSKTITEGNPAADLETYKAAPYPSVSIEVNLTSAPTQTTIVSLEINSSSSAVARCCTTVEDEDVNRWNWDYDFNDMDIVFQPGETSKTVSVIISDDQRDESDETLVIDISSAVGATIDSAKRYTLSITDDDDAPELKGGVVRSITMASLFREVFASGDATKQCLSCHNSVTMAGGYDVTDYKLMIQNSVLIPHDTTSKMKRRLYYDVETGLEEMPYGSSADAAWKDSVKKWIEDGAKNNGYSDE